MQPELLDSSALISKCSQVVLLDISTWCMTRVASVKVRVTVQHVSYNTQVWKNMKKIFDLLGS